MTRWLHADNYSLCTLLLFYVKAFADKAKYPGSIVAKLEVFAELKTISIKKSIFHRKEGKVALPSPAEKVSVVRS